MTRLFNNENLAYSDLGNSIASEVDAVIRPIILKYAAQDVCLRDLSYVIMNEVQAHILGELLTWQSKKFNVQKQEQISGQ